MAREGMEARVSLPLAHSQLLRSRCGCYQGGAFLTIAHAEGAARLWCSTALHGK